MTRIEHRAFLVLIVGATLAFAWVLSPFSDAILWSVVVAIVFQPLSARILGRMPGWRNAAACLTLLLIVLIVILPLLSIAAALGREASDLYGRIQGGDLDLGGAIRPLVDALPGWATPWLRSLGVADADAIREKVGGALANGSRFIAGQAFSFGQSTLGVAVGLGIMLYLLFFLLRDGVALSRRVVAAVPLPPDRRAILCERIVVVIRATVAGDIFVAALQGALGGVGFWFLGIHAALLWGVAMAVLSLLPAIGAALIWLPVALYLLATGAIWQGIALLAYGALVIGLVDNAVRPLLVGNATKIPDYLVLVSTLGGIELFGILGFVAGPVIAAIFLAVWEMAAPRSPRDPAPR